MKKETNSGSYSPSNATSFTRAAHLDFQKSSLFRWEDKRDFEDAQKGFISKDEPLVIRSTDGSVILDAEQYSEFLHTNESCPDTVHPSLWRHARLNANAGLYKLRDRLYEVRGYDMSNMIVIEGDTGYVVLDALTSVEAASAAISLVYRTLGDKPIKSVIIGHSHLDHFGGINGLIDSDEVKKHNVNLYAPEGFTEAALSENILAGPVTTRRGSYQFGFKLPIGPRGLVDGGLGKFSRGGTSSFQYPTHYITYTGQEEIIDGIRFVFQLAPNSEAPASMQAYLPDFKALWVGEIVNHVNHNLCPIRGAKPRDCKAWSGYINEMLQMFPEAEVAFGSHFWPVHGRERVSNWLSKQRDLYKYMHDQTLRLANHGLTPDEIAYELQLPESLVTEWFNRDYYGAVALNVKSIYSFYFGWYDGNPVNLNPLPPAETARRWIECIGGTSIALEKAREAYATGDYQWAVQLLNYIVFAEPNNHEAAILEADCYEQLGYQQESATLRNAYLTAAWELRNEEQINPNTKKRSIYQDMSIEDLLDFLAVRLNGPRAENKDFCVCWTFSDDHTTYSMVVKNAVLHTDKQALTNMKRDADVYIQSSRSSFKRIMFAGYSPRDLIQSGELELSGDYDKLQEFIMLFDTFDGQFSIVLP